MDQENENTTRKTELIPITVGAGENLPVVFPDSSAMTLEVYAQEKIEERAHVMIPALMEAWEKGMKAGDAKIMRDVAEAFKVVAPKGGINVNTNIGINNSPTFNGGDGRPSIEDIIKRMDAEKFEKRKREEGEIIDAEIIEPDEDGKK